MDTFKKVKQFIDTGKPPPRRPSGVGFPQYERQCEKIHVFMKCHGSSSTDLRRVIMDSDATLRQARGRFGRTMKQELVTDGHGFRIMDQDLDQPLWRFSQNCAMDLEFWYESQFQQMAELANDAVDHTTSISQTVMKSLRGSKETDVAEKSKL